MLQILDTSIAVAAEAHNPSILHPAFLFAQRITPEWKLKAPPICTPALSVVKFENGIVLTVEQTKLQVVQNEAAEVTGDAEVPRIVERYTATLPHVRYTGIGTNVSGFVPVADPDRVLRGFLASGPWNAGDLQLRSAGVRLVYDALGTRLTLSIDGGTIRNNETADEQQGILVAGNYHVDISGNDPVLQVAAAARRYSDCRTHFISTTRAILKFS